MIVLYIIGGLLALVILLLCVPLDVCAEYSQELSLTLKYLFIPIRLLPRKEKKEPKSGFAKWWAAIKKKLASFFSGAKKNSSRAWRHTKKFAVRVWRKIFGKSSKKKTASQPEQAEKKGLAALIEQRGFLGAVGILLEVARIVTGRAGRIFRGSRIKRLVMRARIGGENAAQAAINYGRWCAVLFPAVSMILEAASGKKSYDVRIDPCFTSTDNEMYIYVRLRVIPILVIWHALSVLASILVGEIRRSMEQSKEEAARAGNSENNKKETNNFDKGGANNV